MARTAPTTPTGLPPLWPGDDHELRVHGVAGSTPESMLGLVAQLQATGVDGKGGGDPVVPARGAAGADTVCTADPSPGDVSVWKPPAVEPTLRAYSWSSLTSGHWYQAFYLVLLPFMLANLAGWMIVGRSPLTRRWEVRLATFLVRVVGLLVTGVFVVSAQIVVADLAVFQWLRWPVAVGPVATAAVLLAIVVLTRIRQQPGAESPWRNHDDPVGKCSLSVQELMWASPGINVTLRWLHLGAGLGTIALLAAWPRTAAPAGTGLVALGLGTVVLVVVVALLARISLGDGTTGLRPAMLMVRPLSFVGGLAVVTAAAHQASLPAGTFQPGTPLPALRGAIVWIALAVLVAIVLLTAVGLVTQRGRAATSAPAVLLVAASLGAMLGAGIAGQVGRLTGVCAESCRLTGGYVTWLAVGVTVTLAVLIAFVLLSALCLRMHPSSRGSLTHRLTGGASWGMPVLLGCGVLLLVVGLALASGRYDPAGDTGGTPGALSVAQSVVEALIGGPLLAGAAVLAWRLPATPTRRANLSPNRAAWVGRFVGLVAVAAAVWIVFRTTWTVPVLGVALPPRTFTDFVLDVAILLPTAAVVTRIFTGVTNRGVRRGVSVLWDVGTFWPRWFHPFAPPTYSDTAVPRLIGQIASDLGAGHRLVLAPHSQGAVIAAAAVLGSATTERLAMLSYGSPWSHLYAPFFPLYVNAATTADVVARLGGGGPLRWRNLYRTTDPIGGPIDGVEEQDPMLDPCGRGHSDYWVEAQYAAAVAELRMLTAPAGEPEAQPGNGVAEQMAVRFGGPAASDGSDEPAGDRSGLAEQGGTPSGHPT